MGSKGEPVEAIAADANCSEKEHEAAGAFVRKTALVLDGLKPPRRR